MSHADLVHRFTELPEDQQARIDQVAWEFELLWQQGQRPELDRFLSREGVADRAALESLLGILLELELYWLGRHGEPVDRAEYAARFADFPALVAAAFEPSDNGVPTPRRLGDYRLLRRLAAGGMGEVWLAEHEFLGRVDAIKILSARGLRADRRGTAFRQEMEIAGRLQHPHIVQVYGAGCAEGLLYIAMEYLEGTDLARLVHERGPLPWRECGAWIAEAAEGLAHAHRHGSIHRDIKPANLLLTRDGIVKVCDFGLAQWLGKDAAQILPDWGSRPAGTPAFMAPEQEAGHGEVTVATDVYGLGATFYYLLTARYPVHTAEGALHWPSDPGGASEPVERSEAARRLIERMVAIRPADRPRLAEVLAQLQGGSEEAVLVPHPSVRPPDPSRRRGARRVWVGIAALLVLLLGGYLASPWFVAAPQTLPSVPEPTAVLWTPITEFTLPEETPFEGVFRAAEWSPQQDVIAVATEAGNLQLYRPDDLSRIAVLAGHEGTIIDVAWDWTGARLASAGADSMLRVWTKSGQLLSATKMPDRIFDLDWSPTDLRLAGVSFKGLVYVIDFAAGTSMSWSADRYYGSRVQWVNGGTQLVTSGGERKIRFWTPSGELLREVSEFAEGGALTTVTSAGELTVLGKEGKRLGLRVPTDARWQEVNLPVPCSEPPRWSQDAQAVLLKRTDDCGFILMTRHDPLAPPLLARPIETAVYGRMPVARWSPDGTQFLIAGHSLVLAARDGTILRATRRQLPVDVGQLAWHPAGELLALTTDDGQIQVYDRKGELQWTRPQTRGGGLRIGWSGDGNYLATADSDGRVVLWDPAGALRRQFTTSSSIQCIAWSPSSDCVAVGGVDRATRLYSPQTGLVRVLHHPGSVASLGWSEDGQELAVGLIALLGFERWSRRDEFRRPVGPLNRFVQGGALRDNVYQVCYAPRSRLLAVAASYGTAGCWDESALGRRLVGLEGTISTVEWRADGQQLAAVDSAGRLMIWARDGTPIHLQVHPLPIHRLAWSPDGKWLAFGDQGSTVRLWETGTQRGLSLPRNGGEVRGMCWHPSEPLLAFSTEGGIVRLVRPADARIELTISVPRCSTATALATGR